MFAVDGRGRPSLHREFPGIHNPWIHNPRLPL